MSISPLELLKELDLRGVKRAARIIGGPVPSGRKSEIIENLAKREWTDKQMEELIELVRKYSENHVSFLSNTIFMSDQLPQWGIDDIIATLSRRSVDFDKGVYPGFEIVDKATLEVRARFWFESKKLIVGQKTAHFYALPKSVEFRISLPRLVYIFTSNPGLVNSCKKALQETLDLALVPAVEEGTFHV